MNNLQQYLNNLENKQEIKEINLTQIQQERGDNELLEGGELDLREFTNLEKVEIDPKLLKTPLTKLNVDGLSHLKELDWLETKEDTPEEKKLWTELGIESENEKKEVVKEVRKLVGLWNKETSESLKKVQVHFATEKAPKEQLKEDAMGITVITENEEIGYNIYLNLERKDKQGNFCPSLVFWTLAREFSVLGNGKIGETPTSWTHFSQQLEWVKENLKEEYQKEFELILNPSTFPTEKIEISELLNVYYPNAEDIADSQSNEVSDSKQVVVQAATIDKTWQTIWEKTLELVSQELEKKPEEKELKKLAIKLTIRYNLGYDDNDFTIKAHYNSESPFKAQLEQLITNTPLQLELENLRGEKEQLPTSENFEKQKKQLQFLENYLQGSMSDEEYEKIKEEVDKIN